MRKWLRGFVSGCTVMIILMSSVSVYASGGVQEMIDVMMNNVKLNVDGNNVSNEGENYKLSNGDEVPFSLLYKGTTYLPIRKISELIDYEIAWEGESNTISLNNPDVNSVINPIVEEEPDIIEWIVIGYEGDYPFKEYEYKYVNGMKSDEFRYTGNYKEVPVFRNASFGNTPQDIKSNESSEIYLEDETYLFYKGDIVGLDANIAYYFNEKNELYNIIGLITESHTNKTTYINDYYDIQNVLKEKFGNPTSEDIFWYDDLWKDNPSDYGLAIATGDLAYQTVWEFDTYNVSLRLKGDNYKVVFGIVYDSKVFEHPEEDTGI